MLYLFNYLILHETYFNIWKFWRNSAAIQKMCIAKGHSVSGLSRSQDGLDLSDENKIVSAIESLDGTFDQIFITTGALVVNAAEPEKTIRQFTSNSAIDQFVTNAVGPTLILKHIKRLIDKNSNCFIGVLSARVGSIGDNNLEAGIVIELQKLP